MLEVCFGDSVKGALLHAQNYKRSSGVAISFITDSEAPLSYFEKRKALKAYRKRELELQKQAVSLGGRREDVVGISLGLSEGDIKAPIALASCPRKNAMYATYSFERYGEWEDIEQPFNEFWETCIEDLEKLKSGPEKIRIWLDQTPNAQCGLLFVADLFKGSETEIHIVELPAKIRREDGCTIEYRGWGEVRSELFGTFLDRERALTKVEILRLSQRWETLKEENSPLRVFENGVIISADESYYDHLIRREFPADTYRVANIIGNALVNQKIPTGDVFIAKRLRHLINTGELTVTDASKDGFYGTVVGRAKKASSEITGAQGAQTDRKEK